LHGFFNTHRWSFVPSSSKLSEEIVRLKDLLHSQLQQTGQSWLEQRINAYLRQENAVLCDAFAQVFGKQYC
jgi:hypothetical protein